ncbi:DUF427-domain-containing protein, partial [Amniculicola lignicola CBS 123094]
KLAKKLASNGPHKYEHTPRRVRALFNHKYALDTTKAYHVWEHPYYPQFYIPTTAFTSAAKLSKGAAIDGTNETVHLAKLDVGDKSTERVLIFSAGPLKGLVKIDFPALDQWFEEDVPIYQHPKDPYKRVDILSSTRKIRVEVDGVVVAESANPLILYETLLRPRYYLPATSVNWELLSQSGTETKCPYKGKANYYNVTVKGKEYRDLVWYYIYPTVESGPIAGHLCFYNEHVDIWVDGEKEER